MQIHQKNSDSNRNTTQNKNTKTGQVGNRVKTAVCVYCSR